MTRFLLDPRSKCSSLWCSPNIKLDIIECNGGNEAKKTPLASPSMFPDLSFSSSSLDFCPHLLPMTSSKAHGSNTRSPRFSCLAFPGRTTYFHSFKILLGYWRLLCLLSTAYWLTPRASDSCTPWYITDPTQMSLGYFNISQCVRANCSLSHLPKPMYSWSKRLEPPFTHIA